MLDNVLIYLIKNKPPGIAERIKALDPSDEICMSFVTYAELLKGAEGSTRKSEVLKRLTDLTRSVPVRYQISELLCEYYATHFSRLRDAGTPIVANDLWIACHALADDCTLVTNNLKEFRRVKGIRLENWMK